MAIGLTELITGEKPKKSLLSRAWDTINTPLWEGPTRAGEAISKGMESIPTMQQTGEGGLRDWLGWADASAKGFFQGATEGAGRVVSDMTSPLSLASEALGGGGLKRLSNLGRLGRGIDKAADIGHSVPDELLRSKMPPQGLSEFHAVDDPRTISNTYRGTPTTRQELPQYDYTNTGMSTVPPEAARENARMYVEMLDENIPFERELKQTLSKVNEAYPRALGNVNSISLQRHPNISDPMNIGSTSPVQMFRPESGDIGWRRSDMFISPEGIQKSADLRYRGDVQKALVDNVVHELTHAAQQQRKGFNFNKAYADEIGNIGYGGNKFEIAARQAGSRANQRLAETGSLKIPSKFHERAPSLTDDEIRKLLNSMETMGVKY